MPSPALTCDDVEARHLEAGYLARRLSPDDAAAYEAHYFACERCWASLQRATEARAAFGAPQQRSARRLVPWGLAAAAVLALVLGAPFLSRNRQAELGTTRGSGDSLIVNTSRPGNAAAASWPAVQGAQSYRVRLYLSDGRLLLERETADTTFSVAADALPPGAPGVFWQVQALDQVRQPIARSALTPAGTPPPR